MHLTEQPPHDRTPPANEPTLSRHVRRWYDWAQQMASQDRGSSPDGSAPDQHDTPTGQGPGSRPARPQVLLVTSDWPEIRTLQLVLGPIGDTTVARSQDEALRWLEQAEFDVVLWDLELDDADPQALHDQLELRQHAKIERVVFLEPRRPSASSRWLVERAAHTVLHRPLAPRELLRAVARICSSADD